MPSCWDVYVPTAVGWRADSCRDTPVVRCVSVSNRFTAFSLVLFFTPLWRASTGEPTAVEILPWSSSQVLTLCPQRYGFAGSCRWRYVSVTVMRDAFRIGHAFQSASEQTHACACACVVYASADGGSPAKRTTRASKNFEDDVDSSRDVADLSGMYAWFILWFRVCVVRYYPLLIMATISSILFHDVTITLCLHMWQVAQRLEMSYYICVSAKYAYL